MRLTKIICTLGPASRSLEQIEALAKGGMNIARLNLSHGTQADHAETLARIKELNRRGHCIATMLDTKGAEIRTGDRTEPLQVSRGQEIVFASTVLPGEVRPVVLVDYPAFSSDVRPGTHIIVDNGDMSFVVEEVRPDASVVARAREAGSIGSRRHINLPGVDVQLPALTKKDWEDLAFAVHEQADFIALSFVRSGAAVDEVRAFLRENNSSMGVIAKIEAQKAVEHIADILEASDGIMVARGDLGAEIPFELVPAIQDDLVKRCRTMGKPVIVATHMLESMIQHPMPTRAEATDVAHAALTRSDCTMLSGETAMGQHPLLALSAMDRILRETESHLVAMELQPPPSPLPPAYARSEAAHLMASRLGVKAIIVITRSGLSAQALSSTRPTIPIIALAETETLQRKLQILYGVKPIHIDFDDDPETTVAVAMAAARGTGLVDSGDQIILMSDAKTMSGIASSIQIRTIP